MSAYVIVEVDVHDPETYEEYRRLVPPIVAAYGGEYLARGGRTETLEGDWSPRRLVILRFESMERAREWWRSPEYAPVKAMRHRSAHSKMVLLEGVE